jgi:hypothetical protein
MSELDGLLDLYTPPPVPTGLAGRAAAAAAAKRQARGFAPWRRTHGRGGWKRPMLIGSASLAFAFTSAVAADVVSGGRIEIPVVSKVVEAIPVLNVTAHRHKHELASGAATPKPHPKAPPPVTETPAAPAPPPPPIVQPQARPARQFVQQKFTQWKERVAERRASGQPTPGADRIEREAKQIADRREAAGLPALPQDEVEMRLGLREMQTRRALRRMPDNPEAISDFQLQRFTSILGPERRERFQALPPDMQRQMMVRLGQRMRGQRGGLRAGMGRRGLQRP